MEIKLLNKKYKGVFISVHKGFGAIYAYFHLPNKTYRIYWNKGVGFDSYCTKGFNKINQFNNR